eukprot:TRINITY_DN507_c0_g1_i11.p1 TRINITY_DN507_c0_g1~~TRINITY_DN507_c0_g1_i11.p1  ORF type:complete len:458 (-),score=158.61 TRINITY_DN507_c0_g1_i11:921-2294(-)
MAENSWGSWLSSSVRAAYDTVAGEAVPTGGGESDRQTGDFDSLAATTTLSSTSATAVSTQFGAVDESERRALWQQLTSLVGTNVMTRRLSLPVWLFEPTTALTRMAETFEHHSLLTRAAATPEPALRDALVAAFVISAFAHSERVRKPFNPVLGETFSVSLPGPNDGAGAPFRFLAEQVSHHPPLSVSTVSGEGFTGGEVVDVKATYWGNSLEIRNVGTRFVRLSSGDRYEWNLPVAGVANLFIGGAFVDHFGDVEVVNTATRAVTKLTFDKCGWFGANRYGVAGTVYTAAGEGAYTISGFWNKHVDIDKLGAKAKGEGVMRVWAAAPPLKVPAAGSTAATTAGPVPMVMPRFCERLLGDEGAGWAEAGRDSRTRPDRKALHVGDSAAASVAKTEVEDAQRARAAAAGDVDPAARWFRKAEASAPTEGDVVGGWVVTGGFWERPQGEPVGEVAPSLW